MASGGNKTRRARTKKGRAALVASLLVLSIAYVRCAAAPALAAGPEGTALDPGAIEPVRIRFDGPVSCVDSAGFLSTVLRRTPRARPANADERARVFRVSIAQARDGSMRGEVVVEETAHASKPRTVRTGSCVEVVDALALIVALAIDPHASLAPSSAPSPAASSPPLDAGLPLLPEPLPDAAVTQDDASAPAPVVPEPPIAPPVPAADVAKEGASSPTPNTQGSGWSWVGTAGATFDFTTASAPGVVFGASLFFDLGREKRERGGIFAPSLRVRAAYYGGQLVMHDTWGAELDWFTGGLDLCPLALRAGTFLAKPCALGEVGALLATPSGAGIVNAQSQVRPWLAAGGSVLLEWSVLRRLGLEAHLGVRAPITHDEFIFRANYSVYSAPSVMFVGGVGARYHF